MSQRRRATRPTLLWDLNGVLTHHISVKGGPGISYTRPGLSSLSRLKASSLWLQVWDHAPDTSHPSPQLLQGRFEMGLFTSCTARTLGHVLPKIRAAANDQGLFKDSRLHFTREHTEPAPPHIIQHTGMHVCAVHAAARSLRPCLAGKPWETVKCLTKLFDKESLPLVLVVDADEFKAS